MIIKFADYSNLISDPYSSKEDGSTNEEVLLRLHLFLKYGCTEQERDFYNIELLGMSLIDYSRNSGLPLNYIAENTYRLEHKFSCFVCDCKKEDIEHIENFYCLPANDYSHIDKILYEFYKKYLEELAA